MKMIALGSLVFEMGYWEVYIIVEGQFDSSFFLVIDQKKSFFHVLILDCLGVKLTSND